jgi:hypothetical protein
MPRYKSYFASSESVKEQWALADDQAETVRELWEMAWGELQTTYKDELIDDARGYFTKKLDVYDDPETMGKYKSVKVTVSEEQLSQLVNIQRILLMMRSFYTGGQKRICAMVWRGIMKRTNDNEASAKGMAKAFNTIYAPDELLHYLQYVTDKPIKLSVKPYAVPGKKEGTFTLQAWYK